MILGCIMISLQPNYYLYQCIVFKFIMSSCGISCPTLIFFLTYCVDMNSFIQIPFYHMMKKKQKKNRRRQKSRAGLHYIYYIYHQDSYQKRNIAIFVIQWYCVALGYLGLWQINSVFGVCFPVHFSLEIFNFYNFTFTVFLLLIGFHELVLCQF